MIEAAIAAELDGSAENDAFNELVLVTQTDPQAIVWLRAWFRYLRQGGSSYGMDTVVAALLHRIPPYALTMLTTEAPACTAANRSVRVIM